MQNPLRETQTLLHPGNPSSKPATLQAGKDYGVTCIIFADLCAFSIGGAQIWVVFSYSKCLASVSAADHTLWGFL